MFDAFVSLAVPGLAEKRPSVLVGGLLNSPLLYSHWSYFDPSGDRILVQEEGANNTRWYEGHVHVVRQAEVGLRFHGSFDRNGDGRRFHVRFKLSRIPVRRQHQAMDSAYAEDRVLFPSNSHLFVGRIRTRADISIKLYNPLIARNEPQQQAVVSIITLPPGSPPFVVFGP